MFPSTTNQRPSLFALLAVAVAASTVLPSGSEAFLKFPSISRRSTRETIFSDAGDASFSRNYLASMVPPSTSNYFRRLVGFRPVYADTAAAVATGNNDDVAAAKSTDQSGRLFNLFNPFNPLNPFANLITLPTNQNGLNILQIKGKQSIIARANIITNAAVAVGTLQFIQESPFKPIVVVGAGTGPLVSLTNVRMEITANAAGTAAGACAAATMGTVFNPTGVTDGGVLATTLSTDAAGRFRVFINTIPATRASLFSPNSIINHGVRLQVANAADADVMCGTISFVA